MKINFEANSTCNARCIICPRNEMSRQKGEMSDELFHKIIKEGKEMGVRLYSPFFCGEPFVFRKIWDWLDYMEKERVSVILYTNAEFMDVDRLIKYKNIKYVNCSLNATTKETYDKVMRGPNYEKVVNNVNDLFKKAPFKVEASFIKTEENIHEVDRFRKMYPRTKVGDFVNWTNDKHSAYERKGKKRVPCYYLFNHMMILWDGKVVPCCNDYNAKMILGDANKQSLKEIWNSYEWLREKHKKLDFDISICKNCNYNFI